jgi:cytochrome oxidase Cu insertion factor (SCO1/SenC/PrrC family)
MTVAMKKSSLVLAASALLVALGALAASLMYTPSVRMGEVVSSGNALVGGEFEATDHNGKRVTNEDFKASMRSTISAIRIALTSARLNCRSYQLP